MKKMRILINKMSSLGDIIHAFPVLEYFKQCHPDCEIDWIVEQPFSELVRAHPHVHQVISVKTKQWRSQVLKKTTCKEILETLRELRAKEYDVVLDLQGNIKSGIFTGFAKSRLKVGFLSSSVPEWPNLLFTNKKYNPPSGANIREDYLFLAQSAMGMSPRQNIQFSGVQLKLSHEEKIRLQILLDSIKKYSGLKIMVCPGSNWTNKQLPSHILRNFLDRISRHLKVHFLLIWGNSEEKRLVTELAGYLSDRSSIVERLSLPTLQNLMNEMDLVLSMDSLPLHLAGTTSTPTYSIFGSSSAKKYKPVGDNHKAFQGNCPYGKVFEKRCPILRTCSTGACIKNLDDEELFTDFYSWWLSKKEESKETTILFI